MPSISFIPIHHRRMNTFMHFHAAEQCNYLDPERRTLLYGKKGYVSCGLESQGQLPKYGAWPNGKEMTKLELSRLSNFDIDDPARKLSLERFAKIRDGPWHFETEDVTERSHKSYSKLMDAGLASMLCESCAKWEIEQGTWFAAIFGLGQKKCHETGTYSKVRPISNEKYRNKILSPPVEHLTFSSLPEILQGIVYCCNPEHEDSYFENKKDVLRSIQVARDKAKKWCKGNLKKMTWRDIRTLPRKKKEYKGKSFLPCLSKDDLASAYWQYGVRDPRQNGFQIYCPEKQRMEFGFLRCLNFGNIHSIYGFCACCSQWMEKWFNQIGKVPVFQYVDDLIYFSDQDGTLAPLYERFIRRVLAIWGIALAPEKHEQMLPSQDIGEILGIGCRRLTDSIEFFLPEAKVKRIAADLDRVANLIRDPDQRTLESTHKELEKVQGLLCHAMYSRKLRRSLPVLKHIFALTSQPKNFAQNISSKSRREQLLIVLKKCKEIIERRDKTVIARDKMCRDRVHMFTDAAASQSDGKISFGAISFLEDETSSVGFFLHTSQDEIPSFFKRAAIMCYEAIAVALGQRLLTRFSESSSYIVNVDNSACTYGIVNASVDCPKTASVISVLSDRAYLQQIEYFYSYASTHLNSADATTRLEMMDSLGRSYGTKFPLSRSEIMHELELLAKECEELHDELMLGDIRKE